MATDPTQAISDFIASHLAELNTALEGRIVAYNGGKVDVQPVGTKNYEDGDAMAFPVLYGLPLCWLAGDNGEAGVKVPVKVGDKCTIFFKQQPQTDGDVENFRRFSLADAHVLPGTAYSDQHPGNDNVKLYYGEAFIEITPDGNININCQNFNVKAATRAFFDTPQGTFSAKLTSEGLFTYNGGLAGNGGTGGVTARINGQVVVTGGDVKADGIGLKSHTHKEQGDGNDVGPAKG